VDVVVGPGAPFYCPVLRSSSSGLHIDVQVPPHHSASVVYCVIVSQIDDVFHEMAPEVNAPRVLRGMAINRQVVRGEIKAAHKMQETIERIFGKDLPPA